jgi:hypothetical protein
LPPAVADKIRILTPLTIIGTPIPGIGVDVGVKVGVRVAVRVGVRVEVGVGLGVIVGVSVRVGLGVNVGPNNCPGPQPESSRLIKITRNKLFFITF